MMATEVSSNSNQALTVHHVATHPNDGGSNPSGAANETLSEAPEVLTEGRERVVEKSSKQAPGTANENDVDLGKPRKRTKTGCLSDIVSSNVIRITNSL